MNISDLEVSITLVEFRYAVGGYIPKGLGANLEKRYIIKTSESVRIMQRFFAINSFEVLREKVLLRVPIANSC